ncbi:hypothetical protein [Actinobacillus delphinicola]|uniref:Uncharacterized protein n=1 Tax=Actinobacillus delphinicola TaxID=51161 RepID=A0A448TTQ4_9PAST|nr:hypothetical protein [Actinobacillus delphinicola]VEJ09394.1 Uncharacterised protein [Actinobacillus delphinicola]
MNRQGLDLFVVKTPINPEELPLETLTTLINPTFGEQLEALGKNIFLKIGAYNSMERIAYRAVGMNYTRVKFIGEQSPFYLTIMVNNYTEFPPFTEAPRQYIYLQDTTDLYWVLTYLDKQLQQFTNNLQEQRDENNENE